MKVRDFLAVRGLAVVMLFLFHGANFLSLKLSEGLRERAHNAAPGAPAGIGRPNLQIKNIDKAIAPCGFHAVAAGEHDAPAQRAARLPQRGRDGAGQTGRGRCIRFASSQRLAEIRRLLKLAADQQKFTLNYSPMRGTDSEIAVNSRSEIEVNLIHASVDPVTASSWAFKDLSNTVSLELGGFTSGTKMWLRVRAVGAASSSGSPTATSPDTRSRRLSLSK